METDSRAARLDQAAALLPHRLCREVTALPVEQRNRGEELRLRAGRPLSVLYPEGEKAIGKTYITQEDLETVLEIASGASVHTVMDQVRNGYISVRGGHRLGICGTGVMERGVLANLRWISSLSLRVAREFPGTARPLVPKLTEREGILNTLILSPPGGGKTTLLRDLIRCLSVGEGCPPQRVGIADERGELAAMAKGLPMLNVGPHTDVMDGCPKAVGLISLLRGMNPQILAVDEITAPEDVDAILQASGCGVTLLATAHAGTVEDLERRVLYRTLLDAGVFRRLVWISGRGDSRTYKVTDEEGRPC